MFRTYDSLLLEIISMMFRNQGNKKTPSGTKKLFEIIINDHV